MYQNEEAWEADQEEYGLAGEAKKNDEVEGYDGEDDEEEFDDDEEEEEEYDQLDDDQDPDVYVVGAMYATSHVPTSGSNVEPAREGVWC